MSSNISEIRFKTLSAQGHVLLQEHDVACETTSSMGRWKTTTPYSSIEPHPIQLWHTPPLAVTLGGCLLVLSMIIGLIALSELKSNAWMPNLAFLFYGAFFIALCGLLIFRIRSWKEEWIMFPTSLEGHRVAYIKTKRNRETFDAFTERLKERIRASRA